MNLVHDKLLQSIKQKYVDKSNKESRHLLLDSRLILGKQYSQTNVSKYIIEVLQIMDINKISSVIFSILDNSSNECSFDNAFKQLDQNSITEEEFAETLGVCGFMLKVNVFLVDEKEQIKYAAIIQPEDFPTKLLLSILVFKYKLTE